MPEINILISFACSGSSQTLYTGPMEYRCSAGSTDTLQIFNDSALITAKRSRLGESPLKSYNSTLHKQVIRALSLYYKITMQASQIIVISISRARDSGNNLQSAGGEDIKQVISTKANLAALSAIKLTKATTTLQETPRGNSV